MTENEEKSLLGAESWDGLLSHAFREARLRGGEADREPPLPPHSTAASRYDLGDELARDAASVVLLARDREVDRDVALRVLGGDGNGSETSVRRFLEEAQVGAQLQHPGILPVYGLGLLEDGRAYVASRLVEGEPLTRLIGREENTVRLLGILEQAAQAVAYAHARGVAHGALDAARIHVGAHGEVVISGWDRAMRADWDAHRIDADVNALRALTERVPGGKLAGSLESAAAIARAIANHLAERESRAREAEIEAARGRSRAETEWMRERAASRRALTAKRTRQVTLAAAALLLLSVVLAGGGYLLAAREDAEERDRATVGAMAAIREALQRDAAGDLPGATVWARKALALARSWGGEARSRAETLLARLEEDARRDERDRRLLALCEEIALHLESGESERVGAEYEAAFRAWGLDPEDLDPEKLAAEIGKSRHRSEIVGAIDDWASLPFVELEIDLRVKLIEIAHRADPDLLRVQLRVARHTENHREIAALAARSDAAQEDARTLSVLGVALAYGADPEAASLLMQDAWLRRPDDHRLLKLRPATAPRQEYWHRSLESYSALVALHPENACYWSSLAGSFRDLGRLEQALEAHRRAVELPPLHAEHELQLGCTLRDLGRHREAVRALRRAIEIDPDGPSLHMCLGQVLSRSGDREEAVAELRRALELDPDLASAHGYLSKVLSDQGRWEEALVHARRAVDLDPEHGSGHTILASILASLNRPEEALAAARKGVELSELAAAGKYLERTEQGVWKGVKFSAAGPPRPPGPIVRGMVAPAYVMLGTVLLRLGLLQEAESAVRRALEIDAESWSASSTLGSVLGRLGRYEESLAAFKRALDIGLPAGDPQKAAGVLCDLGMTLRSMGRVPDAIEAYREAVALAPTSAHAYSGLGSALVQGNAVEDAVKCCRRAVELDPDSLEAYDALAGALTAGGRFEEALLADQRVAELGPENARSLYNLGLTLSNLGRLEEADRALRRAIVLAPDDVRPYVALIQVLRSGGRLEEARAMVREVLAREPDPRLVRTYAGLADDLASLGDVEGALATFRQLLATGSSDPLLATLLAWHLATCEDERLRDHELAVTLGRRAVRHSSRSWQAWSALGAALYRTGELRDAVRALEICNRLGGAETFFLALALADLGELDKARDAFRRAEAWMLANAPDDPFFRRNRAEAESVLRDATSGRNDSGGK